MRRSIVLSFLIIVVLSLHIAASKAQYPSNNDFAAERSAMVVQIVSRGITDSRVIKVMRSVQRHLFVPNYLKPFAYSDRPLPIGEGQTISQPYIVALMTEALKLAPTDKVLEIGTGSGYQAAILAELVQSVSTIEIIPPLGQQAETLLKKLGYKNVHLRIGDGYRGWPEHAPFDAIILTAAPPKIPEELLKQLKVGGRMIAPIGNAAQNLVLFTKEQSGIRRKTLIPVIFVPMTGEAQR